MSQTPKPRAVMKRYEYLLWYIAIVVTLTLIVALVSGEL